MCGIFGFVHGKKKRIMNYSAFCTLGIANDSRGGDSCGVFIDKRVEYGVEKRKYFQHFMLDSELLEDTLGKEVSVALGHCRKASVGGVCLEKAQPVVLRDKSNRVRYVLLHNGTILNYKELAEKYIPKVDIKDLTDSQVMARIFYYKGYDALSEYYGGSVFFAVDYRQGSPIAYFFKGESKKYNYVNSEVTEERPLYLVYDEEGGDLAFSSISSYLHAIFPGYEVGTPKANTLYKFSKGELEIVKYYSRDAVSQTKPVSTVSTVGTTYPYQGGYGYQGGYFQGRPGYEDYDEDDVIYGGYGSAWRAVTSREKAAEAGAKTSQNATTGGTTTTPATTTSIAKKEEPKHIQSVGNILYDASKNIYLNERNTPIHGHLITSAYGQIYEKKIDDEFKDMWFFSGVALEVAYGQDYFMELKKLVEKENITPAEFLKNHEYLVRWLSHDRLLIEGQATKKLIIPGQAELFTGHHHILGRYFCEDIRDGAIINATIMDRGFRGFFENDKRNASTPIVKVSTSEIEKYAGSL